MQFDNPFQVNDWVIKKFLKVILAIQLAMWSVMGLDAIGLQIPIIRQLIGFIYLTFVPGIIILRILKLHKLSNIETLLYTVGLSLAFLMFTGLFMNTVYPFFGISRPISIMPLIITISVIVLILCILSYVRDNDFSDPSYVDIKGILSPTVLFLCLIPFLAIFGTYLVNYHKNNIVSLLLIIIIAFIVILAAFDKFIPRKIYPLAILIISLSLLFHDSLIYPYIAGGDVNVEYHLYKLVEISSYWNPTTPSISSNAMLSITIFPAIYTYILNMDGTWVFKIIYQVIFSLVPLGLYLAYRKQTDEKTAFLSVFFFMSFGVFLGEMSSLTRQEIAEFFYVLLILLMVNKEINPMVKKVLIIIFSVSLIVSHYSVSYIYMFLILFAFFLLYSEKSTTINAFLQGLRIRFNKLWANITPVFQYDKQIEKKYFEYCKTITGASVILFFVMVISWYIYISSSAPFESLVHIGDHIYSSMFTEFFNPESRGSLTLRILGLGEHPTLLNEISTNVFRATQFFIVVGVIGLLAGYDKRMKFSKEYTAMTYVNVILLGLCIVLPYFAGHLHMNRFYHIILIFLSPFCILGGETVFRWIFRLFKFILRSAFTIDNSSYKKILVLTILIPYFLFNTGFTYYVAGEPASFSLSQERMKESDDDRIKRLLSLDRIDELDVFGAEWLSKSRNNELAIYADRSAILHVLTSYGMLMIQIQGGRVISNTTRINKDAYIFLMHHPTPATQNITDILPHLEERDRIYTSGGCKIYMYKP